jgi:hypothetical protein
VRSSQLARRELSNAEAKRELGWEPRRKSRREGFRYVLLEASEVVTGDDDRALRSVA